jgi:hypothetical protein
MVLSCGFALFWRQKIVKIREKRAFFSKAQKKQGFEAIGDFQSGKL